MSTIREDDQAAHVADELRSERKPPLGMIRRICPRHERLEQPMRGSTPSEQWYELSCVSCRYEKIFRGTPLALEPRRITEEQYRTMVDDSESEARG